MLKCNLFCAWQHGNLFLINVDDIIWMQRLCYMLMLNLAQKSGCIIDFDITISPLLPEVFTAKGGGNVPTDTRHFQPMLIEDQGPWKSQKTQQDSSNMSNGLRNVYSRFWTMTSLSPSWLSLIFNTRSDFHQISSNLENKGHLKHDTCYKQGFFFV